MVKIIKRFIKKICLKIYQIGSYETSMIHAKNDIDSGNRFLGLATIGSDAKIDQAIIHNRFKDESQIIIGAFCQIRGEIEVNRKISRVKVGDNSYIGPGTKVVCSKGISIGSRVLISHNVNIFDNISHPLNSKLRHEDFMFIFRNGYQNEIVDVSAKEINIEDDVWIGFNCTILKGVNIGRGAIIGAGTTVTGNIPENAVVVGNPAKVIKYTD